MSKVAIASSRLALVTHWCLTLFAAASLLLFSPSLLQPLFSSSLSPVVNGLLLAEQVVLWSLLLCLCVSGHMRLKAPLFGKDFSDACLCLRAQGLAQSAVLVDGRGQDHSIRLGWHVSSFLQHVSVLMPDGRVRSALLWRDSVGADTMRRLRLSKD